ncbi:hypothetical protein QR98_0049140 [Sarcoptes scabiei]|uniref:Uncharacterized protein n=1 Tax=Sarcoptes scabiei TaxID=52283 RepID=A0A132A642_SARSC|nr:hypothetical protein QR98_0049140 [Sarcoptes scabiei]
MRHILFEGEKGSIELVVEPKASSWIRFRAPLCIIEEIVVADVDDVEVDKGVDEEQDDDDEEDENCGDNV